MKWSELRFERGQQMALTSTRYLNFETLNVRGQGAITVVKLMMACNDLTVTNQALGDWKKEERRCRISRQAEACRYFIRAQIAHLNEGLKVIEEIQKDHTLSTLVSQCDRRTQDSFQDVQQYVSGGAKRDRFEQLAGRIRHNLTFHYDQSGKLIERAITDGAARSRVSSITRGDTIHLWDFKIADDVVDSIVVRQIWNIPRDADLRTEADRIADEVHQIMLSFVDFAGEFIWKYCEC
jgi:hypothetical protein